MSQFRINLHLAIPVVVGNLGHMMVSVADSVMVGRLGTAELAAVALANSIYAVFMLFGIGVAYGLTPLVAYATGKNRSHLQGAFLGNALVLNSVLGVLLGLLTAALVPALPMLGQEPAVVTLAGPYMYIVGGSIVPLMVFLTFKQFAEGLSLTKVAMVVSLAANVVNVLLNYTLIYGKWGFPSLGVDGAGWATFASRVLMVAGMYAYMTHDGRLVAQINALSKLRVRRVVQWRLLAVGVPSGMQYIFEVSAFSVAAVFAGMIGANALAAHQIAINIASISYMAVMGLGAAATIRVGNLSGAGDAIELRRAANSIFGMTVGWMAIAGCIILFARSTLAGFYSTDPVVIDIAASMLLITVFFQLSDGLQAVGLGALRGFTDVKIPTAITFVAYWLLAVPCAYVFSQWLPWGALGIWYALAGGLTLSAVLLVTRFYSLLKRFERGTFWGN